MVEQVEKSCHEGYVHEAGLVLGVQSGHPLEAHVDRAKSLGADKVGDFVATSAVFEEDTGC